MFAVIKGHKHAGFSSGIEQPFTLAIFTHRPGKRIGRKALHDVGPGVAEVTRAQDVRFELPWHLENGVSGSGVVLRGFDFEHERIAGNLGSLLGLSSRIRRCDVLPGGAAIAS